MKENRLLLFILLSILFFQVQAREWYATPNASAKLLFDSNLNLTSDRTITTNGIIRKLTPNDVIGGTLQAGGVIGSQSEDSDIRIRGSVSFNRYTISNFNSTNFFLFPEAWFAVSQRDKLGIAGKLFLDTTLARQRPSAFDNTPLNLDETDNLLGVPKRRFLKSIKPSWNHSLSEKTALILSYEFKNVTFEDAKKTGRFDYTIHTGRLNLSHQLTPNLLLFSNASTTLYSTADINSSTLYHVLQIGGQYRFSERWEAELAVGGQYSVSDFRTPRQVQLINSDGQVIRGIILDKDSNSSIGSLGYASLTHHYTAGSVKISITQDIRPTGNGALQTSNQAAFNWTHHLSEHLDFNLPASALRGSSLNSDVNGLDRKYFQIAPILRWHLSPEITLGLRYRYRFQNRDSAQNSADSHGAMLSVTYRWRRRSLSR